MKAVALILLFAVCYIECRRVVVPINKNANVDFINMESGGVRGKPAPGQPPAAAPGAAVPAPTTKAPAAAPAAKPAAPPSPTFPKPAAPQAPSPSKPVQSPLPTPPKPVQPQAPTQIKPVPVGDGSVKSLINYFDSQGKASPIRPYSYSQAVKQG